MSKDDKDKKMPRKQSLLFKLFSPKEMKSYTLVDVIKQLEEEEKTQNEQLDLLSFLNENVSSISSHSTTYAELSPSHSPRPRLEPEIDPGMVWINKQKKKDEKSSSREFLGPDSSPKEKTPEKIEKKSVEKTQEKLPQPQETATKQKPEEESSKVNDNKDLKSEVKDETKGEVKNEVKDEVNNEVKEVKDKDKEVNIASENKAPVPEKNQRQLVLEQRAAIAEKRAKLMKLLKGFLSFLSFFIYLLIC